MLEKKKEKENQYSKTSKEKNEGSLSSQKFKIASDLNFGRKDKDNRSVVESMGG
mgnify:CR=1 FL=1